MGPRSVLTARGPTGPPPDSSPGQAGRQAAPRIGSRPLAWPTHRRAGLCQPASTRAGPSLGRHARGQPVLASRRPSRPYAEPAAGGQPTARPTPSRSHGQSRSQPVSALARRWANSGTRPTTGQPDAGLSGHQTVGAVGRRAEPSPTEPAPHATNLRSRPSPLGALPARDQPSTAPAPRPSNPSHRQRLRWPTHLIRRPSGAPTTPPDTHLTGRGAARGWPRGGWCGVGGSAWEVQKGFPIWVKSGGSALRSNPGRVVAGRDRARSATAVARLPRVRV